MIQSKDFYAYFHLADLGLVKDDYNPHKFYSCDSERSWCVMLEPSAAGECFFLSVYVGSTTLGYTRKWYEQFHPVNYADYVDQVLTQSNLYYPWENLRRISKINTLLK